MRRHFEVGDDAVHGLEDLVTVELHVGTERFFEEAVVRRFVARQQTEHLVEGRVFKLHFGRVLFELRVVQARRVLLKDDVAKVVERIVWRRSVVLVAQTRVFELGE